MCSEMNDVFFFAYRFEGTVGTSMYITRGDIGMFGDHVRGEYGRLDGGVWAIFAFVFTILGVLLFVSPYRIVVARFVVALVALVRFVTCKTNLAYYRKIEHRKNGDE